MFFVCALDFCRSGTIKTEMFEELKERLEAAADAAHEEYCDAVKVCPSAPLPLPYPTLPYPTLPLSYAMYPMLSIFQMMGHAPPARPIIFSKLSSRPDPAHHIVKILGPAQPVP